MTFGTIDVSRTEDTDEPLKMQSMKISLKNTWKTFSPRIEVYMYNEDSPAELIEMVRVDKPLATIDDGQTHTYTLQGGEFTPKFFIPGDGDAYVLVKLFDRISGEQLTYSKKRVV